MFVPMPSQQEAIQGLTCLIASLMHVSEVSALRTMRCHVVPAIRLCGPNRRHDREELLSDVEGDVGQPFESRNRASALLLYNQPLLLPGSHAWGLRRGSGGFPYPLGVA